MEVDLFKKADIHTAYHTNGQCPEQLVENLERHMAEVNVHPRIKLHYNGRGTTTAEFYFENEDATVLALTFDSIYRQVLSFSDKLTVWNEVMDIRRNHEQR